jgi:predicted adenylyl cyclase CyaB
MVISFVQIERSSKPAKYDHMPNIEVEYRGRLSTREFSRLKKFMDKNGKFIRKMDRLSLIYLCPKAIKESPNQKYDDIDVRVRLDNGEMEIVLKYGSFEEEVGGGRKEISFKMLNDQFDEAVDFLKVLGFHKAYVQAQKKYIYRYNNIQFELGYIKHFGNYFEVEVIVKNKKEMESANSKIFGLCKRLDIKYMDDLGIYQKAIDALNKKQELFDFHKQTAKQLIRKYPEYFKM